ncbi:MAG: DNA adenine methylase [Pseudomonadota bacterium]
MNRSLSVLRWAGSKRQILKELLALYKISDPDLYIEPFLGSGSLLFSARPKSFVAIDNNWDLINFYEQLITSPEEIYSEATALPREADIYYQLRSEYSTVEPKQKKAIIFFYLNRNCFNGIYRTNKSGQFNVPFSNNRVAAYPPLEQLISASKTLKRGKLICGDFCDLLRCDLSENTFVYLDPPYVTKNQRTFIEYGSSPFCQTSLFALKNLLLKLDKIKVKFALSYADVEEVQDLKTIWQFDTTRLTRLVAGNAERRSSVNELIFHNL